MTMTPLALMRLLAMLVALPVGVAVSAQDGRPAANPSAAGAAQAAAAIAADPVLSAREQALARQLRCLVCQNQSIADSNAELAQDLRRQLHEQLSAGRSDRQIIDFMTARYGDFVLYNPPMRPQTMVLWFGPLLLLLAAGAVAWRVLRSRRRPGAELNEVERQMAARLLDEGNKSMADKPGRGNT